MNSALSRGAVWPDKTRGRVVALLIVLAAGLGTAMTPVRAQTEQSDDTTTLADELIDCAGLAGTAERLACYDALAQPLLGLDEAATGQGPKALHSFTGKGDWDSEVLEIQAPWRVTWTNQGSLLTVDLLTAQEEILDVIGNQIGSGGGRSKILEPGSYRLAVRGTGGWRVQVIDAK